MAHQTVDHVSRSALGAMMFSDRGFVARLFEDRSGRIIAFTRVVLVAVFYIALWVDPAQPVRSSQAGLSILSVYLLIAVVLAGIAWRSWWWDYRLAGLTHAVDMFAFLAAVYFTESVDDDFTSPFLAFFAFLMLSATIRWDWRVTAATGLAASVLYLLVGLAMQGISIEIDIYRFGRRVVYMLVLAIILIWLGRQRSGQSAARFVETPGSPEEVLPPMADALRYAMAQTGAARGAIAWADAEEPEVAIRTVGMPNVAGQPMFAPFGSGSLFPATAQLFDRQRGRVLQASGAAGWETRSGPVDNAFAEHCGLEKGLAIPFTAVTGQGAVLLAEIPGASADHVLKAAEIAREIGAGFDRHSTLSLARENAITLMRDTVARDLHDTIAQSLAGAALRLEALRSWIASGGEPDGEIQAIKAALKGEQAQVRSMINRLREGQDLTPESPASQCLAPLLGDLAVYWSVEAGLAPGSGKVHVPSALIHELRQLVREAVANAVRHGAASVITVTLADAAGGLDITIADNGSGFASGADNPRPRTISERIHQLGGRLEIDNSPAGATLHLHLPRGDEP